MYFLPLPKICWNIRETWSDTLYIMMTLSSNMFWWTRHVGMSVCACAWLALINLVWLCLSEVLLSARASPSPNKVQGCNDSACFHASICLWREFVLFVIMSEIKYLHWPRLTGSVKKDERFLPKRLSFFIYFFILYSSFIYVFFTNSAVQMNALYSHSITRRCNTLWGTNKTLKKK